MFKKLKECDVYLVFDRYRPFSIKSNTRTNRGIQKTVVKHKLTPTMPLPAQTTVLTNTDNKVRLIDMICEHHIEKAKMVSETAVHSLIVTGSSDVPKEINKGVLYCCVCSFTGSRVCDSDL